MATKREKAIEAAAAPVRAKIWRDRDRVQAPSRDILKYIDESLVYKRATLEDALASCGLKSRNAAITFHEAVGTSPAEYIRNSKMELAANLLVGKEKLPVHEIATCTGYANVASFSAAFASWSGFRPTAYRKRVAALEQKGVSIPGACYFRADWWRALSQGSADMNEVGALGDFLIERQRRSGRISEVVVGNNKDYVIEAFLADRLWKTLEAHWDEVDSHRLRLSVVFTTTALFDLLIEKSKEEGRSDRRRGVVLARWALDSLLGFAGLVDERSLAHLQARGWACLGNALRLSSEFPRAEEALQHAQALLVDTKPKLLKTLFDVTFYTACLRTDQRRLEEASNLLNRAREIAKEIPDSESIRRSELARGNVAWSRGDWFSAASAFKEVVNDLPPQSDSYMRTAAFQSLAAALLRGGSLIGAEEALEEALKASETGENHVVAPNLCWLAGLIALEHGNVAEAKSRLKRARSAFEKTGRSYEAGLISLDVAILLAERGKLNETFHETAKAIPLLAAFDLNVECMAALELLREASAQRQIKLSRLRELRNSLGRHCGAPELPG